MDVIKVPTKDCASLAQLAGTEYRNKALIVLGEQLQLQILQAEALRSILRSMDADIERIAQQIRVSVTALENQA
jgi:hypothetical protein